jgi:hypothetical protein
MRFARPRTPAGHVESPAAICDVCTALGPETLSRPPRCIRRALSGSTCPPDTEGRVRGTRKATETAAASIGPAVDFLDCAANGVALLFEYEFFVPHGMNYTISVSFCVGSQSRFRVAGI